MSFANKVLITGAGGFIGSHLSEKLVRSGYDVRVLVSYRSNGSWGWLDSLSKDVKQSIEVITGDIRDPGAVRSAVKNCNYVCHLAALIGIPYSYIAPESYIQTNITGTVNVLQAARDFNLERVVHTSTSEVYGTAISVPIDEDHPLQGQSPYSASKIGADQMALSFFRSFETPVTIIRPFNTYGPRQSQRAVIPTIIGQLIEGQRKLKLGAVHPTRDFCFVKDTARAFEAALTAPKSIGEVINVANGSEITIGDTAKLIARLMNIEVQVSHDDERIRPAKSEVERLWANRTRAEKLLNWKPEYEGIGGFERGLQETIEWFSKNRQLYSHLELRYQV